jgi:hypothetical protein
MVHPNILRFEKTIRDLQRERCAVFSENGEKLFEKESFYVGLQEFCSFDGDEMERMENRILTHNHPTNCLFSEKDITLAVDAKLVELRVVTTKGTFSLRRMSENWPTAASILSTYTDIENDWDYKVPLEKYFREIAPREGLNYNDRDWYLQHQVWEIIAPQLGLQYTREMIN